MDAMRSFWERESLTKVDVLVLGAGISGLSAAISLKQRRPQWRILVLERGLLPYGASTRNAGFACIGSLSEMLEDRRQMGSQAWLELVSMRHRGLAMLRQRFGEAAIGYAERGSHELLQEHELPLLEQLESVNDELALLLGRRPFRRVDARIREFGFEKTFARALVENSCEGELHSGRLMRRLGGLAQSLGIELKTGARVGEVEPVGDLQRCRVRGSVPEASCTFWAARVLVCTNGFAREGMPELDLQPARGQVLITHPVAKLPFRGIFHFDQGYYYFREIQGRVLFGGGRNLDFQAECTTEIGLNERIQAALDRLLGEVILPGRKAAVDMRWSGIMAFGSSKLPILERYRPGVYLGLRLSGMGVALGSELGERLAELVLKDG